jgi:hypothetical protein
MSFAHTFTCKCYVRLNKTRIIVHVGLYKVLRYLCCRWSTKSNRDAQQEQKITITV